MGGVNNWDQNPRFPYRGGGIYFISKIIVFALTKMGVGASSTEVPITFESITLLWRRFRHRDLAGSIRLDVLHVTVLFASRYAAYEGEKTPPLCLGSRQAARVAGLGGRTTRPSNSLSCLALRVPDALIVFIPSAPTARFFMGFLQNKSFRPYMGGGFSRVF